MSTGSVMATAMTVPMACILIVMNLIVTTATVTAVMNLQAAQMASGSVMTAAAYPLAITVMVPTAPTRQQRVGDLIARTVLMKAGNSVMDKALISQTHPVQIQTAVTGWALATPVISLARSALTALPALMKAPADHLKAQTV